MLCKDNYRERKGIGMGQGFNNNIDNISLAGSAIHTYNNEKVSNSLDTSLSFQGNESSSYIYDGEPAKNTRVGKTMDQFEEYLKNQQEKAKASGTDAESEEKADKEAAKEIRNNLTSEEIKKLAMMGVDIESARLSDLMGMINTMRSAAHREATAEMFARIKAGKGDMDNLVVTGGGVKVAGTDVELSQVSISEVVKEKQGFEPGKKELIYLIRNELTLHKENLYKAHFSGMKESVSPMEDSDFEAMKGQLKNIIESSDIEGFSMEDARFLLDNELPINPDTIKTVVNYKQIEGKNVNVIDIPQDENELMERVAKEVYEKVSQISPDTVADMAMEGRHITIQSAYRYQLSINTGKTAGDRPTVRDVMEDQTSVYEAADMVSADGINAGALTARRQMEEIRFAMTMEATSRMVRLDVNIDTKELSKVIDTLRAAEEEYVKNTLRRAGVEPTADNVDMLVGTTTRLEELKGADTRVLGIAFEGEGFTIRNIHTEAFSDEGTGTGDILDRRFDSIRQSYEAVGTAPRIDMGDSISKAFSNVEELLKELNIQVDNETVRAARILGYNSLEITQENIDSVVGYDRQVNQLMDSFYPEAVMGLIKDGINPIDVPIDELNDIIAKKNYNQGVTEATDFATYLRDIEKHGDITPAERESYIGIYRIMDKLAKSGDREAGFVFANKANLTIRNMIGAMRSRRAKGIDVGIDDSFGLLEDINRYGKAIDEQIMAGFTDANAMAVNGTQSEEAVQELVEDIERYRQLKGNVEEFIRETGIENNINNALAVDAILNQTGGLYELVSEVMSKLSFKDRSKEELVDEETGNMARSLTDGDEGPDPADEIGIERLGMEGLLRELNEAGDISLTYDDIRNQITEMMYTAGQMGIITGMDIAAIKTVNAGLNIMSHMARQDRYQIPVETREGTTVMNLTINRGEATGPLDIAINVTTEERGNITAHMTLVSDESGRRSVYGSIVSDTQENNQTLEKMYDVHKQLIEYISEETGIDEIHISMGSLDRQTSGKQEAASAGVSRADACRVAVSVVRVIAEVIR